MKDFFSNIWFAFLVIILILGAVYGIVSFCEPFVTILGGGSILKGILLLPFGIFGTVQFFRGAMKVFESDCMDMESAGHKQTWKLVLYVLFSIFSYFALIEIFRSIPI
jgi:hypothetical protein